MFQVACSLLCIPATSTPSERLFSQAGFLSSHRFSRTTPKNLELRLLAKLNAKKDWNSFILSLFFWLGSFGYGLKCWFESCSILTSVVDPDSFNPGPVTDLYLAFQVNSYPYRVLMTQQFKKIQLNFKKTFSEKIAIYLSLDLHRKRPSHKRSLQASKVNIHQVKRWNLSIFAFLYPAPDCKSGSESGIRVQGPHWILFRIRIHNTIPKTLAGIWLNLIIFVSSQLAPIYLL